MFPAPSATWELSGRRGESSQARQGAGVKFVVPIPYIPAVLQFLLVPVAGQPTFPPRRKRNNHQHFSSGTPNRPNSARTILYALHLNASTDAGEIPAAAKMCQPQHLTEHQPQRVLLPHHRHKRLVGANHKLTVSQRQIKVTVCPPSWAGSKKNRSAAEGRAEGTHGRAWGRGLASQAFPIQC